MKRFKPEISSGSMADIAFLLLIFFLVATTIDQDKGLLRKLPANIEAEDVSIHKRNIVFVWLNSNNQLMVNDVITPVSELKNQIKQMVQNKSHHISWPMSPQNAIISMKTDDGTNYNTYVQVQNEIAKAYREMRNELALELYHKPIEQISAKAELQAIKKALPMNVSEVNSED